MQMLYLVTQRPKAKWRGVMSTGYCVVEAKTKAEAIRVAVAKNEEYIMAKATDCLPPQAEELREGIRGYI